MSTELYYRLDGRNPSVIMGKLPITKEEYNAIKSWKEKEMWHHIALGKESEKDFINSFHSMSPEDKKKAIAKLKTKSVK